MLNACKEQICGQQATPKLAQQLLVNRHIVSRRRATQCCIVYERLF